MKKMQQLFAVLVTAAMMLCFAACGPATDGPGTQSDSGNNENPTTASTKTTPEGTLVVGYNCEADSLDPAEQSEGSPSIKNIVYETLMVRNWESGEYEPWLATEWSFPDETTMQIKLRDDVYFSNGDQMTSDDILYTISRYVNSSRIASSYAFIDLDACTADDEFTVTIKFNTPTGAAEGYIAGMMVYNKEWSEATGMDAMATQCCGTGPYVMENWTSGYGITYTKNENYWGGNGVTAEFDTIEFRFYTETTTEMVDFETGALDIALNLAESDAERIMNGEVEGATVYAPSSMGLYSFVLYDQFEPFQDERVRQAFWYALDIEAMAETALGVLGIPASSVLGTGVSYKLDLGTYEYNPEKAKELLAAAGYADGFDCLAVATSGNIYTALLETAQAYLSEVGINMTVEQYDFSTAITYWQGTQNNGIPVNQVGILQLSPATGDPDQVMTTTKVGSGLTYVECQDAKVQELINAGATTSDTAARQAAYEELQRYMYEAAYQVPVVEESYAYAVHDYIDYFDGLAANCPRYCFTTLK